MAISFLTGLPYDIKELILSKITSTNDLASFARTNKEWASLIIPHHIRYRNLRLSNRRTQQPFRAQLLFAYLAQRADLCKNIRSVYINELYPDPESDRYASPESFMLKGKKGEDPATKIGISHALSSMDGLLKFTWKFALRGHNITNSDAEKISVLNILCRSKTLRILEILDETLSPISLELHNSFASVDCPLWQISDLTSLTLGGNYWSRWGKNSNLTELLKRSPNLEALSISYQYRSPSFTPCHFPKLRELVLWPKLAAKIDDSGNIQVNKSELRDGDEKIIAFLYGHPSIRYLSWTPLSDLLQIAQPQSSNLVFLPNLKKIESQDGFITALIRNIMDSERTTPPWLPLLSSSTFSRSQYRNLKSISQISLDPGTMHLLEYISGHELKELSFWRYDSLEMVERVGDLFPNIEILGVPQLGSDSSEYDKEYTLEDYIQILTHFPSLKYLLDTVIWSLLPSGPEEITMVSKLAQECPKLTHIENGDSYDEDSAFIVLFREELAGNCKVKWEFRGSRERPSRTCYIWS